MLTQFSCRCAFAIVVLLPFYSRRLASTAVNTSIGGFFTVDDQMPKRTDRDKKCVYVCRV